jgi:hypothetical protein
VQPNLFPVRPELVEGRFLLVKEKEEWCFDKLSTNGF